MPGKLIHTNEILVLLGDQYYAERSAKQAVEILGRRRQGRIWMLFVLKMTAYISKSC